MATDLPLQPCSHDDLNVATFNSNKNKWKCFQISNKKAEFQFEIPEFWGRFSSLLAVAQSIDK